MWLILAQLAQEFGGCTIVPVSRKGGAHGLLRPAPAPEAGGEQLDEMVCSVKGISTDW